MIFAEETTSPDLFQQLLALLQAIVMPVWNDLIALIPMLLVLVVVAYLLFTLWQWRTNSSRNTPRLIPRYAGSPPPGVHIPGPARWVAVAPLAMALIILLVVLATIGRMPGPPLNYLLIGLAVLLALVSVIGWLRDAMGEWEQAEAGAHGGGHLAAGPAPAGALAAGPSSAVAVAPMGGALVPVGGAALVAEAEAQAPPPGVHMPGPSPWPFFAPIALMVIFYGVIFSPALIVGGVIMGVIAAAGWLLDASHEYTSTEAVGHAVPRTRDPRAAWPRRLVPIYAAVVAVSLFVALMPALGQFVAGLAPASPGASQVAVPAQPRDLRQQRCFVRHQEPGSAGRPDFELVFNNNNDGVPHNVEIADGPDKATIFFAGQQITGVASITYQVNNLEAGNYYFFCIVHPNMNGTVEAFPETGSAARQARRPQRHRRPPLRLDAPQPARAGDGNSPDCSRRGGLVRVEPIQRHTHALNRRRPQPAARQARSGHLSADPRWERHGQPVRLCRAARYRQLLGQLVRAVPAGVSSLQRGADRACR